MNKAVSVSSVFFIFLTSLLMFSGNLFFSHDPGGYNSKRIVQIALIFLLWVCVLFSKTIRDVVHQRWLCLDRLSQLFISLFFIFGLVASVLADYPFKALQEVTLFLLLLSLTFFVSGQAKKERFVLAVVVSFCIAVIYYAVVYFLNYSLVASYGMFGGVKNWMWSLVNFATPRSFNQIQIVLIPLVTMLCVILHGWQRVIPFASLTLLVFFALVSSGRGILLAWAVTFVVTFFLGGPRYYRMALWQLVALMIAVGMYQYLIIDAGPLSDQGAIVSASAMERMNNSGMSGRVVLVLAAFDLIKENPFLGIGPQHYIYHAGMAATPHNLLLTIGSEWGLIALTFFCLLVGRIMLKWMWRLYKKENVEDRQYAIEIALFSALFGVLAYSMLSSVQVTPFSQTMLFIVIGLAFGYCHRASPQQTPRHHKLMVLIVVTAGLYFFVFTLRELLDPDAVMVLKGIFNDPRIWTNGRMGDYTGNKIW